MNSETVSGFVYFHGLSWELKYVYLFIYFFFNAALFNGKIKDEKLDE